jgi:hypothetical protein
MAVEINFLAPVVLLVYSSACGCKCFRGTYCFYRQDSTTKKEAVFSSKNLVQIYPIKHGFITQNTTI